MKGINALGNQFYTEKLKQINLLEPLPYEEPEETKTEDLEVVDEETVRGEGTDKTSSSYYKDDNIDDSDEGQTSLF